MMAHWFRSPRAAAIVVVLMTFAVFPSLRTSAQESTPAAMTAVDVVDAVAAAVVTVINEQANPNAADTSSDLVPAGAGTGFVIDELGHIVTNNHVVAGGERFEVIFADGQSRPATLNGADPVSDLAVIQVEGELPATVSFGDSSALRVGETVIAIGSPLGTFSNTVTEGIVSALNRDFPDAPTYTNLIQHDAAINPGNSGGPLFNLSGEVVGVNTLGIPQSSNGQPIQGLFFAIPSNTVKTIIDKLIRDGEVVYPYMGVTAAAVTSQLVAQLDLRVNAGAIVADVVPGGPAAAAGIEPNDVITAIDGTEIDVTTSLTEVLFKHQPGETVTVSVQRGDQRLDLEITLGERPGVEAAG